MFAELNQQDNTGGAMKPYRPSNGTEGMAFEDNWCCNCANYGYSRIDGSGGHDCEEGIISQSMLFKNVDDKEYPKEWIVKDGIPTCTAFVSLDAEPELPGLRGKKLL